MPILCRTILCRTISACAVLAFCVLTGLSALAQPSPLAAPPDLTATAAYRQVTLSWSASLGAHSYNIYRGMSAGKEAAAPIAAEVTGPPFVDTGLTNGTRYYYTVRAVGSAGMSAAVEASDTPRPSEERGYYLVTYWAGNSTPLVPDDNGAHPAAWDGPHGRRGTSAQPVKITATFTFQPGSADDEPPSALILVTSNRDGGTSLPQYSGKNNPGRSFSVADSVAVPAAHKLAPAHAPVPPSLPGSSSAASAFTPYQTNPDLFASRAEAVRALQSPDILLRRSGVEWLGAWTQTNGGSGPPGRDARREAFRWMTDLVPALTRGVREMPDRDSDQAVRLLALIGPPARSAIPAVCAALARPLLGNSMDRDRDSLLASLARLCGGPYALAPTLTALLRNPMPETRRTAAAALRLCDDFQYGHIPPKEYGPWHQAFLGIAFPAVTARLDNDAGEVQLAAAQSLEHWTYSPDAPWLLALTPLARAAASPDPALHLAALRTLAFMPGDVSPAAVPLRAALHGDEAGRPWALAALSHAAWTGRARTLDAFLPDLTAPDVSTRHLAAADLRLAASVLWDGSFGDGPYPLPGWQDSRLSRVSTPPDATASASQTRLLAALVRAVADRDAAVRSDAASTLEQIGQETDRTQRIAMSHGRRLALPVGAVTAALAQAASFLQETDPVSAKRLEDLRARIAAPHSSF